MTSVARIEANRRNARHSTGPWTPRGKAIASKNALRHGLTAEIYLIDDEDREAFAGLTDAIHAQLSPVGPLEDALVERISVVMWRLRRAGHLEASLFRYHAFDQDVVRYRRQAAALEVRTGLDALTDEAFKHLGTQVTDPDTHARLVQHGEAAEARRDQETLAATFLHDATGPNALAKVARYESALERGLYRALHELERLQARRAGEAVPPPAAVEVNGAALGD